MTFPCRTSGAGRTRLHEFVDTAHPEVIRLMERDGEIKQETESFSGRSCWSTSPWVHRAENMPGNSRQLLRRRIKGVRETSKVTRAMEMIASARMRRTEQRAVEARPYADTNDPSHGTRGWPMPGASHTSVPADAGEGRTLVVHMTTDKGLCGGLNARLNHSLGAFILGGDGSRECRDCRQKGA